MRIADSLILGIGLMLVLTIPAVCSATELADLPIGHLKITDGPDGKINVEARCVPTKDLITAICSKGNLALTFETECLTYDSVWFPERFRAPAEWFPLLGNPGIHCIVSEDSCRAIAIDKERYDVTLNESQIKEKAAPPLDIKMPKSGIETGLLIFKGQVIPPPYSIECESKKDGEAVLSVNGVTIQTVAKPEQRSVPAAELPKSGQFEDETALSRYVWKTLYPEKIKSGLTPEQALDEIATFASGQSIVASVVKDESPNRLEVVLKEDLWRESPIPDPLFPVNYDFETGNPPPQPFSPAGPVDIIRSQCNLLTESLERGNCIILDEDIVLTPSREALTQFLPGLEATEGMSVLQEECILNEVLRMKMTARSVAVALDEGRAKLVQALEQLLEK